MRSECLGTGCFEPSRGRPHRSPARPGRGYSPRRVRARRCLEYDSLDLVVPNRIAADTDQKRMRDIGPQGRVSYRHIAGAAVSAPRRRRRDVDRVVRGPEEDAVDKEIGRRHDVHPVAEPVTR